MVPGPGHWAYLVREYGGSVRIKKDFFYCFKERNECQYPDAAVVWADLRKVAAMLIAASQVSELAAAPAGHSKGLPYQDPRFDYGAVLRANRPRCAVQRDRVVA
jgi:hypothetical protein